MHFKYCKKPSEGFSLIELLVVISIIGIIATFAYVNFSEARAQARDDMRQTDLRQLELAIEMYKAQNGVYPEMGCRNAPYNFTETWVGPGEHDPSWGNSSDCPEYIVGLVPDYIDELPKDPIFEYEDDRGYLYGRFNSGTDYKLLAHLTVESKEIRNHSDPFARCPEVVPGSIRCGGTTLQPNVYAVYSEGAREW